MIKNFLTSKKEQFYACSTSGTREVVLCVGSGQEAEGISLSISETADLIDLLGQAMDHAKRENKVALA